LYWIYLILFFFSSRRRHTRFSRDWSSDVCSSDLVERTPATTTVGWLPQEPDARPGETLRAYLARRTGVAAASRALDEATAAMTRSEERRVGKEGRARWSP